MKNILFLILLALGISACATQKPLEVDVTVNQLENLVVDRPPPPRAVTTRSIKWYVITPENIDTFVGLNRTLFAMSPDDYENMSLNLAELRRYIVSQQEIIVFYENTITRIEGLGKTQPPVKE